MSTATASPLKSTINPTAAGFAAAAVSGQIPTPTTAAPLSQSDSAEFMTTTSDAHLPFVTVAPKKSKLRPTGAARSSPAKPTTTTPNTTTLNNTSNATRSASASVVAEEETAEDAAAAANTSTTEEATDGLNGDTLRNGTAGTAAKYNRELGNVPVASIFNWVQQFAASHFACHVCGDFLGACSDGVVQVLPSTQQIGGVLMCHTCRHSDTGLTSYPTTTFATSPPPAKVASAIVDLQRMLSNPLSSIVEAATNSKKNTASSSTNPYYSASAAAAAMMMNSTTTTDDDDATPTPSVTATPTSKKSRFVNPSEDATDFVASSTTASDVRNNTTFSPMASTKKKSLSENASPNNAVNNAAPLNSSAEGSENERPTTTSATTSQPVKLAAAATTASPVVTALERRIIAELRILQQEEEQVRTKLNVDEGIAFVQFEKRAAANLKLIKSQKRGSSKQFKMEADEAYEKAKYHIAIDLYDKAIEQVTDGTTRLSVLYGNRSAALFMAMRYDDCIEDCLRVAAKHQQQQNAATGGGEGVPQVAAMNGMVKMYQRAIKAATMMGDLERALTLYNKIDASATTEQMNADRMKVMMAVDELRNAKKLHCTPEGDRLWEVLISKFGDALLFRIKYAESLASVGKFEKAVDILSIIQLPARPPNVSHKIALYKYKSGFEHFEGARETLETHKTDPECAALLTLINNVDDEKQRGNQLFSSRQFAASVTHYTKAVDLDKTNDRILRILYCNRAAAFKELNKLQEGVDDCTRAIALDSNFSKAYARRARCLMNMKEYDGAVRDFKHASKCDPSDRELARELKNAEDHLAKEVEKEKDLYYILGITKTSTDAEVKKKYRELSLKWHPDKCMAQTEEEKVVSERKFKAVSEAYSVLMNAEKRREYDMKVDRERYTSSAYGGAGYGSSAFSGAGAYRSSTTTSSSTAGAGGAGAGAYRSGASRWSKYGAGAGAAGGPGTAGAGGTTGGFW